MNEYTFYYKIKQSAPQIIYHIIIMNEVVIKLIGNYSYQSNHCLGQGVYGKVYEGIERETKEKVAIKKVDLNTFTNDKYLQNAIFSEIYLLKRFDHPNIVKFKDVLSSKNSLYIITEFCKHGDLKQMMKKKKMKQEQAFEIIRQILLGFNQLVKQKIIHRDLKPANILINDGIYKIADFGFAKYVDNFGSQMLKSCVGSPIYMAPQILERSQYTTKCDIWSIGIIFYQMIFGFPPWKARDENQLLRAIKSIPITNILRRQHISAQGNEFLRKSLAYSEESRASWNQLFQMFLQPKIEKPNSIVINSSNDILTSINQLISKPRFLTPTNNNNTSYTPSDQTYQNELNSMLTRNRFVTTSFNPQTVVARSHTPIRIAKQQSTKSTTTTGTQQQSLNQNVSLERKKSLYNRVSIDAIKIIRNECIYMHFICAQLLINHSNVKQFFIDITKFQKFIFLLANLIKFKSLYLLNQLNIFCRTNKGYEQYLQKSDKEHQSYIELEKDIATIIQKQDIIKGIKQQTQKIMGNRIDANFEEKITKLQNLLLQIGLQNATIISNEVKIRAKYNKDFTNVQILDWILDILSLLFTSSQDKSIDLKILTKSEELDFAQYVNKVVAKVQKILNNAASISLFQNFH